MTRKIDANAHLKFKKALAAKIQAADSKLNAWYEKHSSQVTTPIYSSVDLRDSGMKIVPVDSNLYPAGFNNICPEDQRTAPPILRNSIEKRGKEMGLSSVTKVAIIPEFHTTNKFYLENLYYLRELLVTSGLEVKIAWISPENQKLTGPTALTTASEKTVVVEEAKIENGTLELTDFKPDLILLNNDFSGGYPPILDTIKQPILPSHKLGWHTRKKSEHFRHYNRLAREFAEVVGIDPFTITIDTEPVDDVNFDESVGIDRVYETTVAMFERLKKEHEAHKISEPPFVFVKNNSGTYGRGIRVVHDPKELLEMNRRSKNKMSVGKNKRTIDSVVVQEGIPTSVLVDRLPAEPVIYLSGCELIGGFLRTNTERGKDENLNSQGMVFRKLCMTDLREHSEDNEGDELPILECVYGSIALISALATAYELKEHLRGA